MPGRSGGAPSPPLSTSRRHAVTPPSGARAARRAGARAGASRRSRWTLPVSSSSVTNTTPWRSGHWRIHHDVAGPTRRPSGETRSCAALISGGGAGSARSSASGWLRSVRASAAWSNTTSSPSPGRGQLQSSSTGAAFEQHGRRMQRSRSPTCWQRWPDGLRSASPAARHVQVAADEPGAQGQVLGAQARLRAPPRCARPAACDSPDARRRPRRTGGAAEGLVGERLRACGPSRCGRHVGRPYRHRR